MTCSVSLHAVTATWNGTRITGPVLIYHDEISVDPTRTLGDITALVCKSETRTRAGWRRADHIFFGDGLQTTHLSQVRTGTTVVPSRARLSRDNGDVNPSEPVQNGLWCCRVQSVGDDADVEANFVFAGVYIAEEWVSAEAREGGREEGRPIRYRTFTSIVHLQVPSWKMT